MIKALVKSIIWYTAKFKHRKHNIEELDFGFTMSITCNTCKKTVCEIWL